MADSETAQGGFVVAVAGASGNIGRQVVNQLLEAGPETGITVLALSRSHRQINLAGAVPGRIVHQAVDYRDETSLQAAFTGVDTVVFPGSDGNADEMLTHHRNVVAAASSCNVRRFIHLGALDMQQGSTFPYARVHQATEQLLDSSGLSHICVLRASIFTEFFLDAFVGPALKCGMMRLPGEGRGRVSFVSRLDVAAALASAVMSKSATGVFHITGPEALGYEEVASVAAEIARKPLRFESNSEISYREQLIADGVEDCYVEAFATMLARSIPSANFQLVSDDVVRLTGNQPRRFRDCVRSWTSNQK